MALLLPRRVCKCGKSGGSAGRSLGGLNFRHARSIPRSSLALQFALSCVLVAVCTLSVQLAVLAWVRVFRKSPSWRLALREQGRLPHVLVQLPVCNEGLLAVRVAEAAAAMDWPRDRLTIQLLDDGDSDGHAALARDVMARDAGRRQARDPAPRQPQRLQGRQPRLRPQTLRRALCGDLRRRFRAAAGFPAPHRAGAGRRPGTWPSCRRAGAMPTATPTG